ncbi:hypothetical protein ATK17_3256 [Branchiibius hedensis]|uniref:Uncharacterized protein n=1 Tax=Branchiibius hedensis TaxID=672460 RepID=A0A2Y8ZTZ0_9MICO|nr:hypothetical protein ATK17_3256 [Branchiibius hedensis]SSA35881.1 hypothetical protein SAMN04489750_3256 [Branchiibius hedensis]
MVVGPLVSPGGSYTPTVLADQFLALLHGGLLQR